MCGLPCVHMHTCYDEFAEISVLIGPPVLTVKVLYSPCMLLLCAQSHMTMQQHHDKN